MKEDWEEYIFEEVVQFPPVVKLKKGNAYPFIPMENITSGYKYVKPNIEKKITGGGSKFEEGDTLFARITPCLENNKIAQAKDLNGKPGFGSTEYFIFRGKDGVSDSDFVYYFSKTQWFTQNAINSMVGASGRQRADAGFVKSLKVNFPPLPTQQKIASILSAYDDLIENNTKRIELLEEQAQLIYEEWFVRMRFPNYENTKIDAETGLPKGWELRTFADIVDINPKTSIKKGVVAPFVPMGSISTSSMIIDPLEERAVSGGTKFKNGDTLFARITPCLENGKTGFVQFMQYDDSIATGSTEFIVLRETSSCGKYFIYCTSREEEFRENAIKSMVGSDGRQRVNTDCFEKYMVNFAPNEVRLKFEELCEPMFRLIQIFIEQNNKLREARDILLPRLMMGIIEV